MLDERYAHRRPAAGRDEWFGASLDGWLARRLADRYDRADRLTGLLTMLEQQVRLPFPTRVLGMSVVVDGLELTGSAQLVAVVRRGQHELRIGLDQLPLPDPAPAGVPMIAASRPFLQS